MSWKQKIQQKTVIFLGLVILAVCIAAGVHFYDNAKKEIQTNANAEINGNAETNVNTDITAPLPDGTYWIDVELSGGSGRASIESPARLVVADGSMRATLVWSSPNYDYMEAEGQAYKPSVTDADNSVFEMELSALDKEIAVKAETVAMSEPHIIDYVLIFKSDSIMDADGGGAYGQNAGDKTVHGKSTDGVALYEQNTNGVDVYEQNAVQEKDTGSFSEMEFATEFALEEYGNGCTLLHIADGSRFLVVPEDVEVPKELDADIIVLKQPIQNIYLAASAAMSAFVALDELESVQMTGTKEENWYLDEVKQAMAEGSIRYAGKYSEPDYEMILNHGCKLSIQSTMLGHAPEVREKLNELGIPVLVDYSSYESHPLGRTEWVKLYGVLLGKEELAKERFEEQVKALNVSNSEKETGKTIAFFYINSAGQVITRKSNDYISKMLTLAGGKNVFHKAKENESGEAERALSGTTLEMEEFYQTAKDADYIIYNGTVEGHLDGMAEFLSKNELLKDFKAVKAGRVYCTEQNFYQDTMHLGTIISDIHTMLVSEDKEMTYLYQLK